MVKFHFFPFSFFNFNYTFFFLFQLYILHISLSYYFSTDWKTQLQTDKLINKLILFEVFVCCQAVHPTPLYFKMWLLRLSVHVKMNSTRISLSCRSVQYQVLMKGKNDCTSLLNTNSNSSVVSLSTPPPFAVSEPTENCLGYLITQKLLLPESPKYVLLLWSLQFLPQKTFCHFIWHFKLPCNYPFHLGNILNTVHLC